MRLGVEETLGALNSALGPGGPVWFKETHARHLRARDFLAPRRALQARFGDDQVGARMAGTWAGDRWERSGRSPPWLPTGARGRGSRHRWPTGSGRGPSAVLRADPRGAGSSAAAVRGLRTCALFRGRLCRARRPHRPYPAHRPALPGAARQP